MTGKVVILNELFVYIYFVPGKIWLVWVIQCMSTSCGTQKEDDVKTNDSCSEVIYTCDECHEHGLDIIVCVKYNLNQNYKLFYML
jgi:hypothetical protein